VAFLLPVRSSCWRWRDSNRAHPFRGIPGQHHTFDCSCDDSGTDWYSLASVGTRWHAVLSRPPCPIRVLMRNPICASRSSRFGRRANPQVRQYGTSRTRSGEYSQARPGLAVHRSWGVGASAIPGRYTTPEGATWGRLNRHVRSVHYHEHRSIWQTVRRRTKPPRPGTRGSQTAVTSPIKYLARDSWVFYPDLVRLTAGSRTPYWTSIESSSACGLSALGVLDADDLIDASDAGTLLDGGVAAHLGFKHLIE
jgi:hypothetical protein